jgi:hypothetical protein
MPVLIKQPVAPHQSLLMQMLLPVATGPVVPAHLVRIEILLTQLILLLSEKLVQQLHLYGISLIPMALVLALLQLIK